MYSKLEVGKYYKSKNIDGTYMYFQVLATYGSVIRINVHKDNDTVTKLRSDREYTIDKEREYIQDHRVTELTKSELLALIL